MAKQDNTAGNQVNEVVQVNNFKGGMNKDIASFVMKEDTYLDAFNFELVSDDYSQLLKIRNINGNLFAKKIPNVITGTVAPLTRFPLTTAITISITASTTEDFSLVSDTYNSLSEYLNAIKNSINTDASANEFHAEVLRGTYIVFYSKAGYTITSYNITEISSTTNSNKLKIIGKGRMRNSFIIATTNSRSKTPSSYGQIWQVDVDLSPESTSGYDPIINITLLYTDYLDFSLYYPIKIRCDFERSDIRKIYLTDNYNYIRLINTLDENLWDLEPQQFNLINDISFDKINVKDIATGGSYTCGKVAYCYQLFRLYGCQSILSPITNGIDLTPTGVGGGTTFTTHGGDSGELANKSIVIQIALNDESIEKFTHCRLVALHYKDTTMTPEINVVGEIKIPDNGFMNFTDTGSIILSKFTYAEFSAMGGSMLKCGSLEIKDRRLFIANVTEEYFDVDFDARAYRFGLKSGVPTAKVYHGTDGSSDWAEIDINGNITYSGITTGGTSDWDLPETHDCINSKESQRYVPTGYTTPMCYTGYSTGSGDFRLGGKGKNVEYKFTTVSLIDDSSNSNDELYAQNATNQEWQYDLGSGYINNYGFSNFASPLNSMQLSSFQRNETYRFGIVFRRTNGMKSFVKWIGDIKFPSISEYDTVYQYYLDHTGGTPTDGVRDFALSFKSGNNVYTNQLGIQFRVNMSSLSEDIVGYEIVYVKRQEKDRTVVAQGYANDARLVKQGLIVPTTATGADERLSRITSTENILWFNSPEINFNHNQTFQGEDYIELVGACSASIDYDITTELVGSGPNKYTRVIKFRRILPLRGTGDNIDRRVLINDGVILRPGDIQVVDGVEVYAEMSDQVATPGSEYGTGTKGTSFCLSQNGLITTSVSTGASTTYSYNREFAGTDDFLLLNYERPLVGQYGGSTYGDRQNNIYQSTGLYHSRDDVVWRLVFGGDTYVSYFDSLNSIAIYDEVKYQVCQVVLLPVESTINLALREDTCYTRYKPGNNVDCVWLHETISDGVLNLGAEYYTDVTDLYLYNQVYSRGNDPILFIPRPPYYQDTMSYDDRIFASLFKAGGEVIDSWTTFPPLQYKDVESAYGPINELRLFNNKIFCFQDYGVCIPSINDRSVVQDTVGNNIVLGSSGLLERVDYVTTKNGCRHWDSIIETPAGLYFFDVNKKSICLMSNEVKDYSLTGGMRPYLNDQIVDIIMDENNIHMIEHGGDFYEGAGVTSYYDSINKRVFMTFRAPYHENHVVYNNPFTLIINELFNVFSGRCPLYTPMYLQNDAIALGVRRYNFNSVDDDADELYLQGYGDPGCFFGTTYPSTLSLIFNKGPQTKVMDNVMIRCNSVNNDGYDQYDDFFSSVRFYNSYQNTGWMNFHSFVDFDSETTESEVMVRRTERNWNFAVPRNAIKHGLVSMNTKDILDAVNLDYTRKFRERIRDQWTIMELSYDNTKRNLFSIETAMCRMRISFR